MDEQTVYYKVVHEHGYRLGNSGEEDDSDACLLLPGAVVAVHSWASASRGFDALVTHAGCQRAGHLWYSWRGRYSLGGDKRFRELSPLEVIARALDGAS